MASSRETSGRRGTSAHDPDARVIDLDDRTGGDGATVTPVEGGTRRQAGGLRGRAAAAASSATHRGDRDERTEVVDVRDADGHDTQAVPVEHHDRHDHDHDHDHDRGGAHLRDRDHDGVPDAPLPARAQVRRRYGGLDLLACLGGALAAVGVTVLAAGLLPLGTDVAYSLGEGEDPAGPLVAGGVVLAVALLVGGWLAGRAARFDGLRNGLLTGVLFVAITAGYSAGREGSDVVRDLGLPVWLTNGDVDGTRVVSALIALAVVLVAAALGGLAGALYHRRVDRRLLDAERAAHGTRA